MNVFLDKLERKFGRYAIQNLSLYIIVAYVVGYILQLTGTVDFLRLNPDAIIHGQVWRIITWVIVPPSGLGIFTIIMLFFYYSLGTNLERTWGTFKYNVYIFSGMLFTLIGAFLLYLIYAVILKLPAGQVGIVIGNSFSTYYINMSIFLAFAVMYPNMQVLLYFIIPIKMKWMAYVYGALTLISIITGTTATRVAIVMSLLNFLIFFFGVLKSSYRQKKRRSDFSAKMKGAANDFSYSSAKTSASGAGTTAGSAGFSGRGGSKAMPKHKCAICGRTELDNPDLEFRFCSKCNGNYEYCNEHLFTHVHKE